MTDEQLSIEIVPGDDETLVVVGGELDSDSAPVLRKALIELDGTVVCFDLAELSFIDSSGLSLLLDRRRHLESLGGRMRISRASRAVERILDLTGTAELFGLA